MEWTGKGYSCTTLHFCTTLCPTFVEMSNVASNTNLESSDVEEVRKFLEPYLKYTLQLASQYPALTADQIGALVILKLNQDREERVAAKAAQPQAPTAW